ncbi:MAG TPA: long-chain fatty acid--CoA ligase [Propionibacterium sp.]|nr:long-chain fatty acid--CoA ligase [Propionibacterium sp.]
MNLGIGTWPQRRAKVRPHDVAVEFEGVEHTYAEFSERVTRLANAFAAAGVERGDRVIHLGFNHPAALEVFFAAGLMGATSVLLNPRLKLAELQYIVHDSAPKVLAFGAEQADNCVDLAAELPDVTFLSIDGPGPGGAYEEFLRAGSTDPVVIDLDLEETCMIMYTSGTTGRPKGAMLSHRALFYQYVNAIIGQDLRQDEVHLAAAPLFHIAGLNMMTLPTFTLGGRIIIHRGFKADAVLDAIEDSRVTSAFFVPAMLDLLSHHERFADADLSSFRAVMVGGSPLLEPTIKTWQARDVAIMQGFGMTETSPGVTMLEPRDGLTKAGSAGRLHFFSEHRIVDVVGNDVAPGEAGEVVITGPNLMSGYWNKPEETARAVEDGWYHSGDIAVLDEDGYLWIKDRIKDMYISGGENVYPAEVENALVSLPGIRDAAVIGVPDERWGETGKAFVVASDPAVTPDAVAEALKPLLANYKLPRHIELIDELPRTSTGKIQKQALRER